MKQAFAGEVATQKVTKKIDIHYILNICLIHEHYVYVLDDFVIQPANNSFCILWTLIIIYYHSLIITSIGYGWIGS